MQFSLILMNSSLVLLYMLMVIRICLPLLLTHTLVLKGF